MEKEQLAALVTKAQKGDSEALNQLFSECYNDLYYFALKTVKDDQQALDITQEAFVDIINNIETLKEPAAFMSWAKQITYHQCTRHFRKRKDVIVDQDQDGNTIFDDIKEENVEFIPDEALCRDDFKKTILSMIDTLTPEQRSAVMMYYFDEMSVAQIAEIQGVSEGTVKSRLNYARKAIKAQVEDYESKNNIKLHAFPFFPFVRFLFADDKSSLAKAVPSIQSVLPTAASSSAAAANAANGAVAQGAQLAAKSASKGIAAKVAAGVLAAAVAVGGIAAAIIIDGNKSGSSSGALKNGGAANTEKADGETEDNIDIFDSYTELRNQILSVTDSGEYKPEQITEATFIDGEKHHYKVPSDAYNILGYKESFLSEDSAIIKELANAPYETDSSFLVLTYKIPCKDEQELRAMINQDIQKTAEIMKATHNGNTISPDYKLELEEGYLDDLIYGFYTMQIKYTEHIMVSVAVIGEVENPASTVTFKFTGLEEDGQFYYRPKIVVEIKQETSGKWSCGYNKEITTLVY